MVAALVAVGSVAFGSAPPPAATPKNATPPVPPVIGYAPVGASSPSPQGNPRRTPAVLVTTPPGNGLYSAHVSISAHYQTFGAGDFYLTLVAANRSASVRARVLPSRRVVAQGDATTTVEFFVPRLGPGRTYAFEPAVSSPKGRSSFIRLYGVLTRVDLLPETAGRGDTPVG